MREPYGKAVAPRTGPEPCRYGGDAVAEALAGERAGWVWSRESTEHPECRGYCDGPKALPTSPLSQGVAGLRAVVDPMHARRLSAQELGDPVGGRGEDGLTARAVNPSGARQR